MSDRHDEIDERKEGVGTGGSADVDADADAPSEAGGAAGGPPRTADPTGTGVGAIEDDESGGTT